MKKYLKTRIIAQKNARHDRWRGQVKGLLAAIEIGKGFNRYLWLDCEAKRHVSWLGTIEWVGGKNSCENSLEI